MRIAPAAPTDFVPGNVRYRTEEREFALQPALEQILHVE